MNGKRIADRPEEIVDGPWRFLLFYSEARLSSSGMQKTALEHAQGLELEEFVQCAELGIP